MLTGGGFHERFYPVIQDVARHTMHSESLLVTKFNVRANDLFPPWDGISQPTLVLYPAGEREKPRYFAAMHDGNVPLLDILSFLARVGSAKTRDMSISIMSSLVREGEEGWLYKHHGAAWFQAKWRQQEDVASVFYKVTDVYPSSKLDKKKKRKKKRRNAKRG